MDRPGTDLTKTDIAEFNTHHLRREPDEAGMARLKERIERYQPATPPTTVFASIELDDWGTFRECDLTTHAPRSPYDRAVAGIYGIARMADKARADKSSKLNDYIYDCPIDQAITTFLGMTADDYREAAWAQPQRHRTRRMGRRQQFAIRPRENRVQRRHRSQRSR